MNAFHQLFSTAHSFVATASNGQLIHRSVEISVMRRSLTDVVEQRLAQKVEKIFLGEIRARLEAGWR